jgi:hypothetical protein
VRRAEPIARASAWLAALLALSGSALAAPAGSVRRVAVIVGSNQGAAGSQPLRYAWRDAESMARVLVQVGGFERRDVHVLLDPEPAALERALAAEADALRGAGGQTMLFFFFSGHADESSIYLHGSPLALETLRRLLDDPAITIRIGFIDACRGGGWTRAKGLSPVEPFEVTPAALGLASEGSVFIASSSGIENAHESEALRGSFFTHHFAAGLLGAADQHGDGEISLSEAFDYARQLTVRDTARLAGTPQHPSFEVHLRGRQDVVLAHVAPVGPAAPSALALEQSRGPLEIVQLPSGAVLLETPPGARALRVALPPGRYLVRRASGAAVYALDVEVPAGGATAAREADLRRASPALLAAKSAAPTPLPAIEATTVEHAMVELRLAGGVRYRDFNYSGIGLNNGVDRSLAMIFTPVWGITDRWQWLLGTLGFAYRFGRRGATELVPWGGLISVGFRNADGFVFSYGLGLGIDARRWLGDAHSFILGVGAYSDGATGPLAKQPTTWRARLSLGWDVTIRRVVTLHLAVALDEDVLNQGSWVTPAASDPAFDWTLRIGSVQTLGLRPLPLIQVHLNRWLSLDGHAGVAVKLRDGSLQEHYMLGLTTLLY